MIHLLLDSISAGFTHPAKKKLTTLLTDNHIKVTAITFVDSGRTGTIDQFGRVTWQQADE